MSGYSHWSAAPEYALNEQIVTASDMYSLGCVIFSVHAKVLMTSPARVFYHTDATLLAGLAAVQEP